MLADLGENLSTIHLDDNIVSISYIGLKERREKGKTEGLKIDRVERSLKIEGMRKHQTELWVWDSKSMVGLGRTENTTSNLKLRVHCTRSSPKRIAFVFLLG